MVAWIIIGALPFIFVFIISMAVGNGLITSMWYETDEAKAGKMFFSGRTGQAIRDYRKRYPDGKKHLQAYLAFAIAAGDFLFLIAYFVFFARPYLA